MTASPYILALNAAEGVLQIIVARQDEGGSYTCLCAEDRQAPSQGAELLAPALADALERLCLTPKDIGRIAVVRGPGSFTGLRLVLATASGLSRTTGAWQAGLDYLPLLAASALQAIPANRAAPRQAWVLTHARRNLVHLQGLLEQPDVLLAPHPVCEILVCSPAEAVLYLKNAPASPAASLVLGSGLTRNREFFIQALKSSESLLLLPPAFDHPSFDALLNAVTQADYGPTDPTPLYIRPADAIDNLERIAASLGLDPEAAKQRLRELTVD